MKPISTKLQRRILYIPYVNVFVLIFWFINCICLKVPANECSNAFGRFFPKIILPVLIVFGSSFFSPQLEYILTLVCVYVLPIIAGKTLINYQIQELSID